MEFVQYLGLNEEGSVCKFSQYPHWLFVAIEWEEIKFDDSDEQVKIDGVVVKPLDYVIYEHGKLRASETF